MRFFYKEIGGYFSESLPEVQDLANVLTMHAWEVEEIIPKGEGDWEMEIKILPDRAGDAKTALGLAREISALFPELKLKEAPVLPDKGTARAEIIFTIDNINGLLGTDLSEEKIIDFLKRERVQVLKEEDHLVALIPTDRQDLNIKEDLADEVVRLLGYDQIPSRVLPSDLLVKNDSTFTLANKIRSFFAGQGYTEIFGYTFTDHGELEVEKPLSSDKAYLRDSLSEGMKKAVEYNLGRVLFDTDEVKLFEIGTVFVGGSEEVRVVTGLGRRKPKPVLEVVEKKLAEVDIKNSNENLDQFVNHDVHYCPVSIYPRIVRDIAFWCPEVVVVEDVQKIIKEKAGQLLVEGPILFDEFTKEGRKSLAFRLAFQSNEKTLSDDEVNLEMRKVEESLKAQNFEVR